MKRLGEYLLTGRPAPAAQRPRLRPLEPEADEEVVRAWLEPFIVQHVRAWAAARGMTVDAGALVDERSLVEREWHDVAAAAADPSRLAEMAELEGRPAGIVVAALREDPWLGVVGGVLEWFAVDPACRGRRLGSALAQRAAAWFDERGATGAEVYVTATNAASMAACRAAGFRPVDARLLRPRGATLSAP